MKAQTLKVYQEDPETGKMRPARVQLQVTGRNMDDAMAKARTLLADRGFARVRSINAAPGDTLVVYCAAPATLSTPVTGARESMDLKFRKPVRMQKRGE